jgi:hypothetical protein
MLLLSRSPLTFLFGTIKRKLKLLWCCFPINFWSIVTITWSSDRRKSYHAFYSVTQHKPDINSSRSSSPSESQKISSSTSVMIRKEVISHDAVSVGNVLLLIRHHSSFTSSVSLSIMKSWFIQSLQPSKEGETELKHLPLEDIFQSATLPPSSLLTFWSH